jgi:thiol reductant ABC exporter CydD subunit
VRPVDPRLLKYARSTRGFLAITVLIGVATAGLVIWQAKLLSGVIVDVTSRGATWTDVSTAVFVLVGIFAVRALLAWGAEAAAVRSSARAKRELREAAISHAVALGPLGPAGRDPGEVASLVTRGIDALDSYFARYLPQLVLAVIVPIAVLATVLGQDLLSAFIIAVTLPLIPIFMILIGLYTKRRVDRQWRTLTLLSGHFLDLISGLPTLKIFGRAKSQAAAIEAIGDRYRSTTMAVLKITFLSSLALELLASLSVALVAVSVGLRLAEEQIAYSVALFVLVLAPEAYLPLRLVGQHFHAAAEGLGAADRMFTIIETPLPVAGGARPVPANTSIDVNGVVVRYPDRPGSGSIPVTFTARPGTITALVGPSGGGKSSLFAALLGFAAPNEGSIRIGEENLNDVDLAAWRAQVGWLPQNPRLVDADLETEPTVRGCVDIGRGLSDNEIRDALIRAGLADEVTLDRTLAADGSGLSIGQRQRLALARAIAGRTQVLLLDEPTAALDGDSEAIVIEAITAAARAGATVIVVAHRPALVDASDQIVLVQPAVTDAFALDSSTDLQASIPGQRGW